MFFFSSGAAFGCCFCFCVFLFVLGRLEGGLTFSFEGSLVGLVVVYKWFLDLFAVYVPLPPNRWFLEAFKYPKTTRNHLLGAPGIWYVFLSRL